MEIGIIWMTSLRILLVQVLSLWILDKTRVESFWGVVGEGEAELQPWQEGFGMFWVDTGGNYLLCQRLSCPSGTRQLRQGWAGSGIRAGLGTGGTLGTPGLGCQPLGAGEELHFSVKSRNFTAISSWVCSLLQLLGIQQRTWE